MKDEALNDLANLVESHLNLMPSRAEWSHASLKVAREELAAMRTPVTAAALIAGGWECVYSGRSGRTWRQSHNSKLEIGFWDDGNVVYFDGRGDVIPFPSNMHDLNELARLLGGVA